MHPRRRVVEKQFGLKFKRVAHDPQGQIGGCYWTVNRFVEKHGGEMVLGWQILEWPELCIEALHHAVWRDPSGNLIDLTEKYPTDMRLKTTFSEDASHEISLARPVFVESKHHVLLNCAPVNELIQLNRRRLDFTRSFVSKLIDKGAVWSPEAGLQGPPQLFRDHQAEVQEFERYKDLVSRAFLACAAIDGSKRVPSRRRTLTSKPN